MPKCLLNSYSLVFEMSNGPEPFVFLIGSFFLTHGESLNTFCVIRRDFSQFGFIWKSVVKISLVINISEEVVKFHTDQFIAIFFIFKFFNLPAMFCKSSYFFFWLRVIFFILTICLWLWNNKNDTVPFDISWRLWSQKIKLSYVNGTFVLTIEGE